MNIICSTSAWRHDLDFALGRIAHLGFQEVDLIVIESWGLVSLKRLVEDYQSETARVEALLQKHSLRAVSINTAFTPPLADRSVEGNAARRDQIRAVCRFMQHFGISIGAHYPGHRCDWKNDPQGVWSDTVASLGDIQAVAGDAGVILAPEIHGDTPFETADAARRLFDEMPGLAWTYEPSHFVAAGRNYEQTADLLEGAAHCHVRTCAPGLLQAPPPMGMDAVTWMIRRLRQRCYQGVLSIEYLPDAGFPVEDAITRLRAAVDDAG